jgi:hypothetical protein
MMKTRHFGLSAGGRGLGRTLNDAGWVAAGGTVRADAGREGGEGAADWASTGSTDGA